MIQRIEIKDFDKKFGAYICINTSECESWAVDGFKPIIHSATSKDDLDSIGWSDEYVGMKIGEVRPCEDYEGCYIMRVG